jgi:hypothetical protein
MLSLADLDEKRVAIVLHREGDTVVLTGVAVISEDVMLGRVLRVEVGEAARSIDTNIFMIPEADIKRLVHRQSLQGCDYCIAID